MSTIVRHRLSVVALLLTVPGLAFAVLQESEDNEKEIAVSELPDVIQKALRGVTIDEAETNADASIFEIDIEEDGIEIELRLSADGRLLGVEIEREDEDGEADDDDAEGEETDADEDGDDADDEDADTVTIESLPAAARTALAEFAGNNRIMSVERESKKGRILFEAAWKDGAKEHEATVTEDGTLVELEESVLRDSVPERVRALSGQYFKDGGDLKFERKLIAAWEIEGTVNGKGRELLVTPTGARIEFDDEDDDDDEEDE